MHKAAQFHMFTIRLSRELERFTLHTDYLHVNRELRTSAADKWVERCQRKLLLPWQPILNIYVIVQISNLNVCKS